MTQSPITSLTARHARRDARLNDVGHVAIAEIDVPCALRAGGEGSSRPIDRWTLCNCSPLRYTSTVQPALNTAGTHGGPDPQPRLLCPGWSPTPSGRFPAGSVHPPTATASRCEPAKFDALSCTNQSQIVVAAPEPNGSTLHDPTLHWEHPSALLVAVLQANSAAAFGWQRGSLPVHEPVAAAAQAGPSVDGRSHRVARRLGPSSPTSAGSGCR